MNASLYLILFASIFLLIDARSIGVGDEVPKVLTDTFQQSFQCALKLGPRVRNIPHFRGLQILPEDNPALNDLWGCIWKKKEIMDEDGTVNEAKLKEYLVDMASIIAKPSEKDLKLVQEITEDCKNVHSEDDGLKAIKMQNCITRYAMRQVNHLDTNALEDFD